MSDNRALQLHVAPLEHHIISHPGRRRRNEDCVFPEHVNGEGARTFIVCDGVGGHSQGELASAMACRTVGEFLSSLEDLGEAGIREAIAMAENRLSQHTSEFPESRGMATTIVGLHPLGPSEMMVYWVGDSRLYHIREGEVLFKTKDHSLVQMMVDRGEMTEQEAANSQSNNIITQAINDTQKPATPSTQKIDGVQPGDIFILMSDGVIEGCPESNMIGHLIESDSLKAGVARIRKQCEERSHDNFSLIALQVTAQ